jgi:uncharacterized membrane protein HdeD (DUF308 family)
MSYQATPLVPGTTAVTDYYDDEHGNGWVVFSGILLLVVGTLNIVEGIAAIGNAHFFVGNAAYIVGTLNTWGWIILCIGAAQVAVSIGIFARSQFSRWAGVTFLTLNILAQLLMLPAYPFWSLALFALDIIAVFGLVVYGGRLESA